MAIKLEIKCKTCGQEFTDYESNKRSSFCSLPCYWKARKTNSKYAGYWTGKKRSFEDRRKMSLNRIGLTAKEKHPNWKGGISSEIHKIRNSFEYNEWRKKVFERDWYKCLFCGYKGKNIEADHIKRFSDYPELRFEVSNGRTLCKQCHLKVTFPK